MAASREGDRSGYGKSVHIGEETRSPNVTDLLQNLHLTAEEEAVLDFSDEEEDESTVVE